MNILFVCTGNTCRSPIAMALLKNELALAGLNGIHAVDSAGISAVGGQPAAAAAARLLAEQGINIREHKSKMLTPALVKWADLILVMTASQQSILQRRFSCDRDKIRLLKEYSASNKISLDIDDPYGWNEQIYAGVIEEILGCVKNIMPKLKRS